MKTIKAISLWQPWASAVAVGSKRIETRGWSTNHRGPLLIHAAKRRYDKHASDFAMYEHAVGRLPARVPFGALVAICDLTDVQPAQDLNLTISAIERAYGDYSWGRFGWILENVRALPEPIGFTGRQGLFQVPVSTLPPDFVPTF